MLRQHGGQGVDGVGGEAGKALAVRARQARPAVGVAAGAEHEVVGAADRGVLLFLAWSEAGRQGAGDAGGPYPAALPFARGECGLGCGGVFHDHDGQRGQDRARGVGVGGTQHLQTAAFAHRLGGAVVQRLLATAFGGDTDPVREAFLAVVGEPIGEELSGGPVSPTQGQLALACPLRLLARGAAGEFGSQAVRAASDRRQARGHE